MPSLVMTLPEQAFLPMQLPVQLHTIPNFPLLCKENTVTEQELKMTFRHRIGQYQCDSCGDGEYSLNRLS